VRVGPGALAVSESAQVIALTQGYGSP